MKLNNKELVVSALENGTVIDHIPSEKLFEVVSILHIEDIPDQITIGNNLSSKKIGCKGIIKITGKYFEPQELNKIALVAPNAKINIIKNYEVVEKRTLGLPEEVTEILQCVNPMCVTNQERNVATRFELVDAHKGTYRCHFCERLINHEDLLLK